jgi:glycine hydroxymethyltransferase
LLQPRPWLPPAAARYERGVLEEIAGLAPEALGREIVALVARNRAIHDADCVNLDPAGNVLNPRAEAVLAAGLGSRPSLGYPGDKHETGLEAIERIEVLAAELAATLFGARHVELRVASGALANLYAFMATAQPGDAILALPAEYGGHASHHAAGAAGRYGLVTHLAPGDPVRLGPDLEALRRLARQCRPKLIVVGGSLNLFAPPLREIRAIADEVSAWLLYDAAHMSGPIAGGRWPRPLAEGAHLVTMSTYKSLGGPAGGLILTDEPELARRLEAVAYPGLTANFDVARTAALALTLVDWLVHGPAYATMMLDTAAALAGALAAAGLPVWAAGHGFTRSHQLALDATGLGGGPEAARRLRRANLLTCGVRLPLPAAGAAVNGLRLGTPEAARRGMRPADMPTLAGFIARALAPGGDPDALAAEVTAFRRPFDRVHFVVEDRP